MSNLTEKKSVVEGDTFKSEILLVFQVSFDLSFFAHQHELGWTHSRNTEKLWQQVRDSLIPGIWKSVPPSY